MKIAVLALQGAFVEHEQILEKLGISCLELRQKKDLEAPFDGLILPGGESTVQGKLLQELGMLAPLKEKIQQGLPVLATCAGMILLAGEIAGQKQAYLQTIPMVVRRNAYGRQLGSFVFSGEVKGMGKFPMVFIRGPYAETVGSEVEILAKEKEHIVALRYQNQLALAFHPELTDDLRMHQKFLSMIASA